MKKVKRHIHEVRTLTKKEIYQLKLKVAKRDKFRCVICGKMGSGVDTHEVLFKSSGAPQSAEVYQERYMASLCPEHHHLLHDTDQRKLITVQILIVLRSRHHYKYPQRLNHLLDLMQESFRAEMLLKLSERKGG